ncbi:MAG: hypothetical protein Q4D12_09000, partial [Bacteroidales bacterium]|nr:hypothetical protein [Bacteroidales bacterium]
KIDIDTISSLVELSAFIRYSSQIKKNKIILTIENASVARRIYKDIKKKYFCKHKTYKHVGYQ